MIENRNKKDKECQEKLSENKVVSHHTKNLLKDAELEEKELIDEICKNLEE
ncbi:MAG: hypothetical protein KGD73_10685 [Candidatus Lokiarchaeota archaeon]|nr:hypothetical protein [Candidatus Lokiarchaeota archaeon]